MKNATPKNLLRDKSYKFALRNIGLYRSGTSIGANVVEATQAQSKADFVHKLSISLKELSKHSTGSSCCAIAIISRKTRQIRSCSIVGNYRRF